MKLYPTSLTGAAIVAVVAISLVSNGSRLIALPPAGASSLGLIAQDELNLKRLAPSGAVCVGNAAADTAAMKVALALAAVNPGSTIRLPACAQPYIFNVAAGTFGFSVPSQTVIRGDGSSTTITWNDATASDSDPLYLFGPASSSDNSRTSNITLRDFTISGSGATAGPTVAYPILMSRVDGLTIQNVNSENSRSMGIAAQYCTDVRVVNNRVNFTRSDGINISLSANVTVSSNSVSNTDDDSIAVQSGINEPWGVRRNLVIADNRIFGGNGIRVGGARQASISGNQIDSVRSFGVSIEDMAPASGLTGELAPPQAVSVTGNTITNVLFRGDIDGQNSGHAAIIITGNSARAGTAGAIPGEPNTSTGLIKDPLFEFRANSTATTTPTPSTFGILVSGNVIARTLPPTDSSDPRFTRWSDLGQGQIWLRDGFHDPSLNAANLRPIGVYIFGGVQRDILVIGNILRGTTSPVVIGDGIRTDATIRGNRMSDYTDAGLLMNSTGATRIVFDGNDLDADPYLQSPGRSSSHNGTWTAIAAYPTGILFNRASNVFATNNHFRNMNNVTVAFGNPGLYLAENIVEADVTSFGSFSASNKGIGGVPENSPRFRYARVGSDPSAANFGQVLAMPIYP